MGWPGGAMPPRAPGIDSGIARPQWAATTSTSACVRPTVRMRCGSSESKYSESPASSRNWRSPTWTSMAPLEHQQEFLARMREHRRRVGEFARRVHHEGFHGLDLAATGQRFIAVFRAQPAALQGLAIGHAHQADEFVLRVLVGADQLRHAHAVGFGQAQHGGNRRLAQPSFQLGKIALVRPVRCASCSRDRLAGGAGSAIGEAGRSWAGVERKTTGKHARNAPVRRAPPPRADQRPTPARSAAGRTDARAAALERGQPQPNTSRCVLSARRA